MKKAKKPLLLITLAVAVLFIAIGGAVYLKNQEWQSPVKLPAMSEVVSVYIENFTNGVSQGYTELSKPDEIESLRSLLSETKKTLNPSLNDFPTARSYLRIEINTENEGIRTFLWADGNKLCIEIPYVGIYRTTQDVSAAIYKLYNIIDPDGTPDKLGSYRSINLELVRGENWRQIVNNSEFKNNYPFINGSTVCVSLGLEFARQHLGVTDDQAFEYAAFETTKTAYEAIIGRAKYVTAPNEYKIADIILATYPSPYELAMAEEDGIGLDIEPVCHDAFVFITHKDNPIESLTIEQIRGIYSGEITNWSEVGGNDTPIIAYQRDKDSGSQTGMEQLVMQGARMSSPIKVPVVMGMDMLINHVAEYKNDTASIGYTYKYYIDNLYKNENIKILRIDGIQANNENIANNAYTLAVSYYGVVRNNDGANSLGRRFLDWILSDEGQKCVEQAGYVPLDENYQ
ncbi:hypothetical protein FACS1894127_0910 [Clostridia bacterium]|nr:hypothetical protein FACS1894127_0910 [Clostridia bacterium]